MAVRKFLTLASNVYLNNGLTFKPLATAPSPAMNGDMYYSSTLNKFQKYENGAWSDLGSSTGSGGSVDLSGINSSLDLKAPKESPTFTGTVSGITAAMVGLGNVTNVAQMPLSYLDTDGTFAANSDIKIASQKAIKTYVDAAVSSATGSSGATKESIGLGDVTNVAQMPISYLDVDGTLATNSDTKVASQKAVKTYVDTAVDSKASTSYVDTAVSSKMPLSYLDTDTTLAANSAVKVPSQSAVKSYADTKVAKTTTVNGYALSSNISITKSDIGLGNVDNTSDNTKNSAVATLTNKTLSSPAIVNPAFSGTVTGLSMSSLTGTLAISAGGTGQTTAAGALNALLPAQTSNSGKVLQTDGTNASWVAPATLNSLLPSQTSNSGKVLQTNGTNASWVTPASSENPTLTNPTWTTQTLSFSNPIGWDANNGGGAVVTLTGNTTMDNPTNLKNGATYVLKVIQDSVGNRKITAWGSMFKWPGGVTPVLSTTADSVDLISFYYDGTILIGSYLRGIA